MIRPFPKSDRAANYRTQMNCQKQRPSIVQVHTASIFVQPNGAIGAIGARPQPCANAGTGDKAMTSNRAKARIVGASLSEADRLAVRRLVEQYERDVAHIELSLSLSESQLRAIENPMLYYGSERVIEPNKAMG